MRLTKEQGEEFEKKLIAKGYRKYIQHYKREDYLYWKSFEKNEDKESGYSVGFAFYDYSKYPQHTDPINLGISLVMILGNNEKVGRLDIEITDDSVTDEQFEGFCNEFYQFFINQKSIGNEENLAHK